MPGAFEKQQYFISEFHRLIPDNNMKEFILGDDNFASRLSATRDYLLYMSNCLTLSYLYVYGCYRQLTEYSEFPDDDFRDFIVNKDNNNARVLNSLKKTYTQYHLTHDLIQYVLLDLQFDMLPGSPQNLSRVFGRFCSFSGVTLQGESFNLVKYFNYIAKWRLSPNRFDELTNEAVIEMFLDLISNMSFLQGYLCRLDGDDYAFVSSRLYRQAKAFGAIEGDILKTEMFAEMNMSRDPFADCVPCRRTIIKGDAMDDFIKGDQMDTTNFYYLTNIECKASAGAMDLAYMHTDGVENAFFRVCEKDPEHTSEKRIFHLPYDAPEYYYEITGGLWNHSEKRAGKKKGSRTSMQIHTINYKYIKNFALAVSDAIGRVEGTREVLFRAFGIKHADLLSGADGGQDLDSIVVVLMIEESPTVLLQTLFSANLQLFYDIVLNIDRRFANQKFSLHNKARQDLDGDVERLIKEKMCFGEHNCLSSVAGAEKRTTEMHRLRPVVQAELIVSALSELIEEDRQNEYIYGGNIFANIATLKNLKTIPNIQTRVEYVRNILIDTFKHLLCFYAGVFAYGEKKVGFDLKTLNAFLPRSDIAAMQKDLADSFMKAAKRYVDKLKADEKYTSGDVFVYIEEFIAMCNKCYQPGAGSVNNPSYREKLYSAVGKYEIIDLEVFNHCIYTHLGRARTIDETNVDRWVDFALVIMEFFKTGSFSDTPVDHRLMDAIYPFTASYSKRNENRDGQITVTFTISIDIDEDGASDYRREINVLTEFSYNLREVFYCLPNVQRANDRWWMDPLLISFTGFNAIFE